MTSRTIVKSCLVVLAFLVTFPALAQQTMYVDDELVIQLRTGQGNQFRILKGLKSGTPVTVLEQNEESGYTKVETRDGTVGWVTSHYLSPEPIAEDQLAKARAELKQTREALEEARSNLQEIRSDRNQLSSTRQELSSQVDSLSEELKRVKSISSNALNLDKRNRELQETIQELRNEVELLTAENQRLEDKRRSNFLLLGGGLVLLGVLIAVIVPWLKPSKKHDTWA
ncbi:TIGR04211 family SH3 domain-containing protein [Marinobacteraceae bacterium S3BR75-40.1]